MEKSSIKGRAQTVLGPVYPDELGITLPHEHLLVDLSVWFTESENAGEKLIAYQPVMLENFNWLHYNASGNLDNLRVWDEKLIIDEADETA